MNKGQWLKPLRSPDGVRPPEGIYHYKGRAYLVRKSYGDAHLWRFATDQLHLWQLASVNNEHGVLPGVRTVSSFTENKLIQKLEKEMQKQTWGVFENDL